MGASGAVLGRKQPAGGKDAAAKGGREREEGRGKGGRFYKNTHTHKHTHTNTHTHTQREKALHTTGGVSSLLFLFLFAVPLDSALPQQR